MSIYFQLFSARNTPLDEALRIVAQTGYTGVEAYAENFVDPANFEAELQNNALSVPSIHVNLPALRNDITGTLAQAREFGCKHIVCPYLEVDQRPVDAAQWQALGRELDTMSKQISDAGFVFAWHNHDFEFTTLDDGSMPIEHLFETASTLNWEIDVAWIVRAAAAPAPWIKRYENRITAVHLKDIAPQSQCMDEDGWADLGEGVVAWQELMPALLRTPAELYVTEHDNPADLQRFASRSIKAAKGLIA